MEYGSMEVITIESEAFKKIAAYLETIKQALEAQSRKAPFSDLWLDNSEVCSLLKISKRTLQTYRDQGDLSFSQVGAKIYYRASDVEKFLNKYYQPAFSQKR